MELIQGTSELPTIGSPEKISVMALVNLNHRLHQPLSHLVFQILENTPDDVLLMQLIPNRHTRWCFIGTKHSWTTMSLVASIIIPVLLFPVVQRLNTELLAVEEGTVVPNAPPGPIVPADLSVIEFVKLRHLVGV